MRVTGGANISGRKQIGRGILELGEGEDAEGVRVLEQRLSVRPSCVGVGGFGFGVWVWGSGFEVGS